ncbi:MAG: septal ring lytic transglycosylase RlpA family protein [Thermodesulfobacteriaceae bacterium]|nr:septal ring lytic transglycosylase RlpA family protein [Thermodesulfobacteriaceae bacterium]MCX8041672.1 septal ring lytic transglycosylase RlpA family protein [Thermodesulfobacteriaceae bacterium]MDW8135934.1 septal ring lytic transglycosylase RlpA family protein [Thermodesulfobacterium sp.]
MKRFFLTFLGLVLLTSCARPPREIPSFSTIVPGWLKPYTINGKTYYPLPSAEGYEEECIASWYGPGFHGKEAASGEIYDMYEYTAAHKLLPIGTYILVTNLENKRQLVVRINDRGPFVEDRCIDLSFASAKALGMVGKGLSKVKIVALSEGERIGNQIVYRNKPNIRFNSFYLQVGAFKNYSNALSLKIKLEREFERVEIEPYYKNGTTFYRVQVYLTDELFSAFKLSEDLKRQRFRGAFLVAK